MGILPILLIAALSISFVFVLAFAWAVRGDQLDDLDVRATLPLRDGDTGP